MTVEDARTDGMTPTAAPVALPVLRESHQEGRTANVEPWLTRYAERGFRLVFYSSGQKGPSGSEAIGWTTRHDKPEDYRTGMNVGTFLGHEIEPGKFLCDVDFDWTDGLALVQRILPDTGFGYGRASRTVSHAFYTTSTPHVSKEYTDIDGTNFVELRGTKLDGSVGLQTMIPYSIHPSGETIEFRADGEIRHDDSLPRRVCLYAVACILFKHLGQRGLLHDTRLAVAGFLLGEGLSEAEVTTIGEAVAEASGNDVADVALTVRTTAEQLRAGKRVQGKGTLTKALGENGRAIVARIRDWIGSKDFLTDDKDRILTSNLENFQRALDKLGVTLSFDTFSQKALIRYAVHDGSLDDAIVSRLWFDIEKQFHFLPSKDLFFDYVQDTARRKSFNPVLDYLRSLTWDGNPRLDQWLIRAAKAANSEYVKAVSSIVLIAAVRRLTQPGCKFDEMLVLESGTQGMEKSSALRTLCVNEDWFSDDLPLNVDSKQIIERTSGKWIIEASDLSGMNDKKAEHLKGMLSRQVDGPVRLAYARIPTEVKRQWIVIGTTNSYQYLSDFTGNRRFWPVRIEKFEVAWLRDNRDQLWAEAFTREQAGACIRLPQSLWKHAGLQQERRRNADPWEEILKQVMEEREGEDHERIANDEIYEHLGVPKERQTRDNYKRVAEVMQLLGFRKGSVRNRKNEPARGWVRSLNVKVYEEPEQKP